MGRLPALKTIGAGAIALHVIACDRAPTPTPASRSEQVIATGTMPTSAPSTTQGDPHAASGTPAPPRKLCEPGADTKGRTLPKAPLSHAEATGVARGDGSLPAAQGRWTWINFWAAWCGPCKEEIPRLFGWRDQLAKAKSPIHLVFVSLDDDRRQLDSFLESQPANGLKTTLWLPEGATRDSWLASLRMKSAPELPEQALIDPTGHVRCFIEGAVEDADYPGIEAYLTH